MLAEKNVVIFSWNSIIWQNGVATRKTENFFFGLITKNVLKMYGDMQHQKISQKCSVYTTTPRPLHHQIPNII